MRADLVQVCDRTHGGFETHPVVMDTIVVIGS